MSAQGDDDGDGGGFRVFFPPVLDPATAMRTLLVLIIFIGGFLVMDGAHRQALGTAVKAAEARGMEAAGGGGGWGAGGRRRGGGGGAGRGRSEEDCGVLDLQFS